MSAITLQASATGAGIITLAAPATANNYTLTLPAETGTVLTTASTLSNVASVGMKNRVINGAMVIDQRNAGASVTPAAVSSFVYTLDRWSLFQSQASKFSIQRNAGSVTPPAGYTNYLGVTSASAYTSISTDQFLLCHIIEGYNIADLGWGTAAAATVTLSFWVRSSLTGQFSATLENQAGTRSYVATYTIVSANTWEQKTITIPGITSGVWNTDNSNGMFVLFNLGVGSNFQTTANTWYLGGANGTSTDVKLVGTNAATFYITGVQLEKGSTATSFEFRHYGSELQLCERYYYSIGGSTVNEMANVGSFQAYSGTQAAGNLIFPRTMRAAPSFTSSTVGNWSITTSTYTATGCTGISAAQIGTKGCQIIATIGSSILSAGNATNMQASGTLNARLNFNSEL